jgi:hypothetical protein
MGNNYVRYKFDSIAKATINELEAGIGHQNRPIADILDIAYLRVVRQTEDYFVYPA